MAAGIVIPHFCWHPSLGKAGSCRACAVTIQEGPVKGIQMSCMLEAIEGMVVSTTDQAAVDLRQQVMEWLMLNHPHDCPVCDEGGECQLQEFTIAGGHSQRRYDGLKRTHRNQDLGAGLIHEMNRCIQCYRCVRFYQDYAGGTDFGVMGRAGMVYFGRQQDGQLESRFSGNLADICPTGVFTDKPARFKARYWDYQMAPSICQGCSIGCATTPVAHYRELIKIKGRRNDRVNGLFLCDRGRYDTTRQNMAERPRVARLNHRPCSNQTAIAAAAVRLRQLADQHGPGAIAIVGSARLSLEGNILAAKLADALGGARLCYHETASDAQRADASINTNAASLEEIRSADLVVVNGCDPSVDGPMAALAIRQAWRNGAKVFITEDSPDSWLETISISATKVASLAGLPFDQTRQPVIICSSTGRDKLEESTNSGGKLAILSGGPNQTGCNMLARIHGATSLDEAAVQGAVAAVLLESDLEKLPDGVSAVLACDWLPTVVANSAEIFLPSTAWTEMDGTCINYEGRAQRFCKLMEPGLPLACQPGHPSHDHRNTVPGGDPTPTDQHLSRLIELLTGFIPGPLYDGPFAEISSLEAEADGLLVRL
jgi:NADH-quinone oxidoreductase subunit G